jgi:hypothetical protein
MGLIERQTMARDQKGVGLYRKPGSIRECSAVGRGGGEQKQEGEAEE